MRIRMRYRPLGCKPAKNKAFSGSPAPHAVFGLKTKILLSVCLA